MKYFKIVVVVILVLSSAIVTAQSTSTVATTGVVNKHNTGRKAGLVLPAGVKGVIHGRVFTTEESQIYLEGAEVRIKGTKISTVLIRAEPILLI